MTFFEEAKLLGVGTSFFMATIFDTRWQQLGVAQERQKLEKAKVFFFFVPDLRLQGLRLWDKDKETKNFANIKTQKNNNKKNQDKQRSTLLCML